MKRYSLLVVSLLALRTAAVFSHLPILVDGLNTSGEWAGTAPATPGTGAISAGEFIWNDPTGDERTDFAGPDTRVDIDEIRVTSDPGNLYLYVKMAGIDVASGDGAPQVILSVDLDQNPLDTGQEWLPSLSDTKVGHPDAYWEYCVRTNFGSGVGVHTMFNDGFTEVAWNTNAITGSPDNGIETQIQWSDLGVAPPTVLRFTVTSYRSNGSDEAWDIGGLSDALDAVTDKSGNTWEEVMDGDVDFYFTLSLAANGDVIGAVLNVPPSVSWVSAYGAQVVVSYSESIDPATPGSVTISPQQEAATYSQTGAIVSGSEVTYSLDGGLTPDVLYDLAITGAADLSGLTAGGYTNWTVRAGLDAALTFTFEVDTATIGGVTEAFVTGNILPLDWGPVNELPTLNGSIYSGDVVFPIGSSTRGEYKYWTHAPLFSEYGYEDFGGNRILILRDDGSHTQGLAASDVVNSVTLDSSVDVVFSLDLRYVSNPSDVRLGFANVGETGLPFFELDGGRLVPSGQQMNDSGNDGDAVAGDGFYSTTITFSAGMGADIEYKYILFTAGRYFEGAESPGVGQNFIDRVCDTVSSYTKSDPYQGSLTELPVISGTEGRIWRRYR